MSHFVHTHTACLHNNHLYMLKVIFNTLYKMSNSETNAYRKVLPRECCKKQFLSTFFSKFVFFLFFSVCVLPYLSTQFNLELGPHLYLRIKNQNTWTRMWPHLSGPTMALKIVSLSGFTIAQTNPGLSSCKSLSSTLFSQFVFSVCMYVWP